MRFASSCSKTRRRWRADRPFAVALAIAVATLVAACNGDSAAEPTATAATPLPPTASPTSAATSAPSPAATVTPVASAPWATPPPSPVTTPSLEELNARRTGDPLIDGVIDVLFGGDRPALDAIVRTQSAICHQQSQGIGDLAVCPEGVAGGTEVEFFPTGVCEGFPLHAPPHVSLQIPDRTRLVAVIRVLPRPEPIPLWPDGEHLIIFEDATDSRVVTGVYIEDGEVVRTQQACTTVEFLLELGGDSAEDLLPSID